MSLAVSGPDVQRRWSLEGKTAVVVGATSVMGLGLARALGRAGARLMLCGLEASALELAMQDLQELGIDTRWQRADCTWEDEVLGLVDATLERMGDIDVLATALPEVAMAHRVAVAVVANSMRARGGGRILHLGSSNVAGAAADSPWARLAVEEAARWRSCGVRVNTLLLPEQPLGALSALTFETLEAAAWLFAAPCGQGLSGQFLTVEDASPAA